MQYKKCIKKLNNSLSTFFNRFSNKTFFFLLLFHFALGVLYYKDNVINLNYYSWQTQELLMNYSYGFIRRGLLGSFTHLIYNYFIPDFKVAAKIVQSIGILLFALSILLFFASLLKYEKEKSFCYIILLFISLHFWGFQLKQFALAQ